MRASMMFFYWWFLGLSGMPAMAATLNITADYNPAAYEAGGAKFINTTPCNQFPTFIGFWCRTTATVDTPQAVRFDINIRRALGSGRNGVQYISFPAATDVILTNKNGGKSYSFKFILTDVGSEMIFSHKPNVNGLVEVGDCHVTNSPAVVNNSVYTFFSIKPERQMGGGKCRLVGDFSFLGMDVELSSAYLGYKLKTPDPLKMENGTYTGQLVFTMGNNKDFDFGGGTYNDSQLVVNFSVTVRHQIKVEFPPGGDTIILQPLGGWRDGIYKSKDGIPSLLQAELPYRIWYSSTIRVTLRCEYQNGDQCFIRNTQDGHLSPIQVYWVNPFANTSTIIKSGYYKPPNGVETDGARLLSFKITDQQALKEMMARPGRTYKGKVTIVFDARI